MVEQGYKLSEKDTLLAASICRTAAGRGCDISLKNGLTDILYSLENWICNVVPIPPVLDGSHKAWVADNAKIMFDGKEVQLGSFTVLLDGKEVDGFYADEKEGVVQGYNDLHAVVTRRGIVRIVPAGEIIC